MDDIQIIKALMKLTLTGVFLIIGGYVLNIAEYKKRKANKLIDYGYLLSLASIALIVILLGFDFILLNIQP